MKRNTPYFSLLFLSMTSAGLCMISPLSHAMQPLYDQDLRMVDGQDGISITTECSKVDIDQLYWEDRAGTSTNTDQALRATANNVKIRKNTDYNAGSGAGIYMLGSDYSINVGANSAGNVGMDFRLSSRPSIISIDNFAICSDQANSCGVSIGNLALQTGSPSEIRLITSNGLFNSAAQAELTLGLRNMNIYMGLKPNTANNTTYNQLILKNTNFNFYGKGVAFVTGEQGFMMHTNTNGTGIANKTQSPNTSFGYIDFARVADPDQTGAENGTYGGTSAGLNLEFMTKKEAVVSATAPSYALAAGVSGANAAQGLIRVGASGRMVNSYLQIRGTDGTDANGAAVLGYASPASGAAPTSGNNASVIGSTGIGLRLRGEFTASGDSMLGGDNTKATKLEIGGAGSNTYGFEFGELSPLLVDSASRAYFDSGNVYLNLTNTKNLKMPENTVLNSSRFGGTNNSYLTSSSDYIQQIHDQSTNPYSLVLAVRGADFQAISKRGRFTSSSNVAAANAIAANTGMTNEWGLGLPFYNLNTNLAIYATTYNGSIYTLNNLNNTIEKTPISNAQRLGFALALSVQGKDSTGSKTTSIMIVDAKNQQYIGLRNIDMLLRGYGSVGLENGQLNMSLPDLLMVMNAEIAAGRLPTLAKPDGFNTKDDVLLGLKIKLLGDMNFSLIANNAISTNNGNRLSIIGEYKLKDGTVQLSDPIQDSMIGLDRMVGLIRFNNAIVINKDNVGFNYNLQFNPERDAANVFRVRDINFYPPTGAAQRLGEMVMTGGRLNAELTLKPRN